MSVDESVSQSAGAPVEIDYPTTSRAAVLGRFREPVEIQEFEVPELEPGGILVKVDAATMCGSDVHIADGDMEHVARTPVILGHEIVGRVVALGKDRTTDALDRPLKPGDRIVWAYGFCGHCYYCTIAKQPFLCPNTQAYGWGSAAEHPHLIGGFADYVYVGSHCKPVLVPDNVDSRVAASATCAFSTIVHAYEELGELKLTDTVVIQGTGPVGLYALAWAVQAGVRQVIAIGAPANRLAIAEEWGATRVLDVTATEPQERLALIRELTDGRGADIAIECSGSTAAFEEGFGLLRRGGRYLVIGAAEPRPASILPLLINTGNLRIIGSISGDVSHYYRALQFLSDHGDRFRFDAILGNTYGLDGVDTALEAMRTAAEVKPVVIP